MVHFFSTLIGGAVGSTLLLPLAVALCVFIFEDATVVIVGVLAADGAIPVPLALASLYIGMIFADLALYTIGRLARTHQKLGSYVDHEFTAPFRTWLSQRYRTVILSGHFVPGLRSTTYVASGFFHFPFSKFAPMAITSGLSLITTLFTLSYVFGSYSSSWVGEVRWGVAIVFILTIFLVARHNVVMYKKGKIESAVPSGPTGIDTPLSNSENV